MCEKTQNFHFYARKTLSKVIVLNEARMSVEKWKGFRAFFSVKHYYGDLNKCIINVLSQVSPLLDKLSRSYEQKTKIRQNMAENHSEFHAILTVSDSVDAVRHCQNSWNSLLFWPNLTQFKFFVHSSSRVCPKMEKLDLKRFSYICSSSHNDVLLKKRLWKHSTF